MYSLLYNDVISSVSFLLAISVLSVVIFWQFFIAQAFCWSTLAVYVASLYNRHVDTETYNTSIIYTN